MARLSGSACVLVVVGLSGCLEEQRYAVERARVYMPPDSAPAFEDDDDKPVFVSERVFHLQIRPPSAQTLQSLTQAAQGKHLPFPRMPWVERQDLEVRVDYTLENRSDQAVNAMVFLDGIDEFFEYTPGPEDFHQYERRLLVQAHRTARGTISELEMDEVAIDLATVVNGAPNTALVVQFQSQSGRDPRVQQYIPDTVPGLVGFHMGLQSAGLGGGETAPDLELTLSVRVQDHGDRISSRGEPHWELPTPVPFVPVVPEEAP